MAESFYQAKLIIKLRRLFPDILILKNDTSYLQGVPDLTLLFEDKWAMLEVKAHEFAAEQPNQNYYIEVADAMSFGAFIYPENEEEVLRDLQRTFQPRRSSRVPKRQ